MDTTPDGAQEVDHGHHEGQEDHRGELEPAPPSPPRGDRGEHGASLRDIAEHLNASGVGSKRGGQWHPQIGSRVLHNTDGYKVVYG